MPVPQEFWEISNGAKHFVVSYPRSGSRWFRLLLTDMANCLSGIDPGPLYNGQLEYELAIESKAAHVIPVEGFCPNVYEVAHKGYRVPIQGIMPRLEPIFRSHNLEDVIEKPHARAVYLFRDPIPMLISYLNFAKSDGFFEGRPGELEAFCEAKVDLWARHLEGALTCRTESPDQILIARYGDHTPFEANQLAEIAEFLDFPADASLIREALGRFRVFLGRLNTVGSFEYPRGGNHGEATITLDVAMSSAIKERTEDLLQKAIVAIGSAGQT